MFYQAHLILLFFFNSEWFYFPLAGSGKHFEIDTKKKGHIPWIFLRHFFQLETSQVEISIARTLKVNKILKPSVSDRILYIFGL